MVCLSELYHNTLLCAQVNKCLYFVVNLTGGLCGVTMGIKPYLYLFNSKLFIDPNMFISYWLTMHAI